MGPKLIHITGASGSGTSTLGRALAAELGIAYFESDDYYWLSTPQAFTSRRDDAARLSSLLGDLKAKQGAVMAGSIMGWGAELENAFDLVVFLYLDASIRVERLRARETERFGNAWPAFLEWAAQYDVGPSTGRSLAKHRAWLASRSCPVLELHGDLSVGERVATVLQHVPDLSIGRGSWQTSDGVTEVEVPFINPSEMKTGEPLPGWKGRFWRSESMSFSHYEVATGCSIHEHDHPNEEVWVVVDGRFEVTIGGVTQVAGPGHGAIVPANVRHSVRVLEGGRAVVASHPIRTEFR